MMGYEKLQKDTSVSVSVSESVGEEAEKWVKYYSSKYQILLVGEGDFSFSLCLAHSFGSASNIVATSLDSRDDVLKKYKKSISNLDDLQKRGAWVSHGVDATKMKLHPFLKMIRFDRIIFNFPHAGFHGKEDSLSLINQHKNLVRGFFMNARCMLRPYGEIHVNHKTTAPFSEWNLEKLGKECCLRLIECSDFKKEDYPGYNNKRGDSFRCDESFPLGKCSTFKFACSPKAMKNPKLGHRNDAFMACSIEQRKVNHIHYPLRSHIPKMNEGVPPLTSVITSGNGYPPVFEGSYSNSGIEILGGAFSGSVHGITSDLERSLQPWLASTNVGYPQREQVRNTGIVPSLVDLDPLQYCKVPMKSEIGRSRADLSVSHVDPTPLVLSQNNWTQCSSAWNSGPLLGGPRARNEPSLPQFFSGSSSYSAEEAIGRTGESTGWVSPKSALMERKCIGGNTILLCVSFFFFLFLLLSGW